MYLRCGGIFNDKFTAESAGEKIVKFCQHVANCGQEYGVLFFDSQGIVL